MNWLESKIMWWVGAIIALIITYFIGRKDGKNGEKLAQKDKTLNKILSAHRIDSLSDDTVNRLPSRYD